MTPLALTDYTLVSALGAGRTASLDALRTGVGGLTPCTFETVDIPTWVGEVAGVDVVRLPEELTDYDCRNNRLAEMALQADGFLFTALAAREKYGAHRVGVFLGTSTSGILETELAYRHRDPATGALPPDFRYAETHNTYSVASYVRARLGLTGPAVVVSAACASTSKAFGNAARMIEAGFCDAAIVGGADSLCLTTLYGFRSLGLISPLPCRPFDAARDGISIGEGAGFVLLERADDTAALLLRGIGESSDAHHMSSPHPEGRGAEAAMRQALDRAGMDATDIDYVKLHGTATSVGDAAEDKAVTSVFGEQTPCSSLKGHIGHTLGASGIIEIGLAALGLQHGLVPATIGTVTQDPAFRAGHIYTPLSRRIDAVMCNAFGFGGSNCSLVLGRTGGGRA
jgi:3-oxoacyl-[acyl-carrier-protein] synthase-1